MEDIKMTDQKAQYARLKPDLDKAFSAVMESMSLTNGPQVASFARQLEMVLGVKRAIPSVSDMDALKLALQVLDLPAGAEVIVPAFGYAASVELLLQQGLRPVFADVLPDTFTLDPRSVENLITVNTAAIMPVHLFGQCAEMKELMAVAEEYKLWLLEDVTQALGAQYVHPDQQESYAGSIGHLSFTSFYPSKPLGRMGDAGALFINAYELLERVKLLKGEEAEVQQASGGLDALQAAMLEVKLKYLDEFKEVRHKVAAFYNNAFAASEFVQAPFCSPNSTHIYHQYTIKVPSHLRDGLKQHLFDNFIPSVVYYPEPLHQQEIFKSLKVDSVDLPIAELLSHSVLSLPMHESLKEDQLEYITRNVIDYIERQV